MSKSKREKATAARAERAEATKKSSGKSQAEQIKEYQQQMQAGIKVIQKELECTAVGMEAPKGTNGAVSTGSLCLDLSIGGGFPKHRMTTLAGDTGTGKSTLVGKSEGIALSQGHFCHHLDLEGAADRTWLLRNGTDLNLYLGGRGKIKTLNYVPDLDSGDSSFRYISRILDLSIDNGAILPSMYYQDSLAACIPESMLENDEKGSSPDQAILFSNEVKRVRIKLRKANSAFVAINQIRINPRCRFGCLHGDTKISFVDGRVLPIREIVDQRIEGSVWSYDTETKSLRASRIKNWYDNGTAPREHWLSIETEGPGSGRGTHEITVTKAHKLLTAAGEWIAAEKIQVGDELVSQAESFKPGTGLEFLLGMMSGDAGVNENYNKGAMVLCNQEQPEYLSWKVQKLSKGLEFKQYETYLYVSRPRVDLDLLKRQMPERNPLGVWDRFSLLSLAIWFLDDGHYKESHKNASLSIKRFKETPDIGEEISSKLNALGYECTAHRDSIAFTVAGFEKLSAEIAKFVPPCMQYKLNPSDRDKYQEFELEFETIQRPVPVKVRAIKEMSKKKARSGRKFDLEIEGTHNYVACSKHGGLVVHNSPQYEPGGQAIRFYPDVKLWLTRTGKAKTFDGKKDHPFTPTEGKFFREDGISLETNPDGTEDRYVYVNTQAIKNRVFPPWRETYFRINTTENGRVGRGIDRVWDVIHFMEEVGLAQVESKKEVYLKGQAYDYFDLKKEILAKPDLFLECQELLTSGKAFEMYFDRIAGVGGKIGIPSPEEDLEAEKIEAATGKDPFNVTT
jgi:RecA/RadA recombinase